MKLGKWIGIVGLIVSCGVAWGQATTWAQLIQGKAHTPAYGIKELPEEFKALQLTMSGSSGGIFEMMLGAMAGSLGSVLGQLQPKDAEQAMGALFMLHVSKGDETELSGQKYLVAYKLALKEGASFDPSTPPNPKNLEWRVTYVRTDSIAQITPLPNLNISEVIERLEKTTKPSGDAGVSEPGEAGNPQAIGNMKQLATALMLYSLDYDDILPGAQSTATVRALLLPYSKDKAIMRTLNPNGGQVLYNVSLGSVSISSIPDVADTVCFYDSQPWPDGGRPAAFVDGSSRWFTKEGWVSMKQSILQTFPRAGKLLPADYMVKEDPLAKP